VTTALVSTIRSALSFGIRAISLTLSVKNALKLWRHKKKLAINRKVPNCPYCNREHAFLVGFDLRKEDNVTYIIKTYQCRNCCNYYSDQQTDAPNPEPKGAA